MAMILSELSAEFLLGWYVRAFPAAKLIISVYLPGEMAKTQRKLATTIA